MWPANAARYKGVRPYCPFVFTSAPLSISNRTVSGFPPLADSDRGVFPFASVESINRSKRRLIVASIIPVGKPCSSHFSKAT